MHQDVYQALEDSGSPINQSEISQLLQTMYPSSLPLIITAVSNWPFDFVSRFLSPLSFSRDEQERREPWEKVVGHFLFTRESWLVFALSLGPSTPRGLCISGHVVQALPKCIDRECLGRRLTGSWKGWCFIE